MKLPDNHTFDVEFLDRHGRLCQADAQAIHGELCRQIFAMLGGPEPSETTVIGTWNQMSPEAPWDCPPEQCKSRHVNGLTEIFRQFESDMLREQAAKN